MIEQPDAPMWPNSPDFLPPGPWAGSQQDPMQTGDPWAGARLPSQQASSSSQDGNWDAYQPTSPQAARTYVAPTAFQNDDELNSSVASESRPQAQAVPPAQPSPNPAVPVLGANGSQLGGVARLSGPSLVRRW